MIPTAAANDAVERRRSRRGTIHRRTARSAGREVERAGRADGDADERLERLDREADAERLASSRCRGSQARPRRRRCRLRCSGRERDRAGDVEGGEDEQRREQRDAGGRARQRRRSSPARRASCIPTVQPSTTAMPRGRPLERGEAGEQLCDPRMACASGRRTRPRARALRLRRHRTNTGQSGIAPRRRRGDDERGEGERAGGGERRVDAARRPDPSRCVDRARAERHLHRVAELRGGERVDERADAEARAGAGARRCGRPRRRVLRARRRRCRRTRARIRSPRPAEPVLFGAGQGVEPGLRRGCPAARELRQRRSPRAMRPPRERAVEREMVMTGLSQLMTRSLGSG